MIQIKYISRLIVLIIIQVAILNRIDFLGFANPMVFLLFFLMYPFQESRISLLWVGFWVGIVMDTFCDTGGIYAASTLFVVFVRPFLIRLFFGQNFDYQVINLFQISFLARASYVFFASFLFHCLFFLLELFNFEHFLYSLPKVLISSVLTTMVCLLSLYLFGYQKR